MRWKDLLGVLCMVALVAWFLGERPRTTPGPTPTPQAVTPSPHAVATPEATATPARTPIELHNVVDANGNPVFVEVKKPTLTLGRVSGSSFQDLTVEAELKCAGKMFVSRDSHPAAIRFTLHDKSWQFGGDPALRMFPEEEWPADQPYGWQLKLKALPLQEGSPGLPELRSVWGSHALQIQVVSLVRLPNASPFARSPNLLLVESAPQYLFPDTRKGE